VDYSKCRWVERRNTKLRGNRQPTSPLLVANLDIESDELIKYLSSCPVDGQLCLPNYQAVIIMDIILIYNYMEEINIDEIFFEWNEKKFLKILGL